MRKQGDSGFGRHCGDKARQGNRDVMDGALLSREGLSSFELSLGKSKGRRGFWLGEQ